MKILIIFETAVRYILMQGEKNLSSSCLQWLTQFLGPFVNTHTVWLGMKYDWFRILAYNRRSFQVLLVQTSHVHKENIFSVFFIIGQFFSETHLKDSFQRVCSAWYNHLNHLLGNFWISDHTSNFFSTSPCCYARLFLIAVWGTNVLFLYDLLASFWFLL